MSILIQAETARPANAAVGTPPASASSPEVATAPAPRLRIVMAGALLAMLLAALDQNIVNTALPRMVGELGGMAHLSWVVTAFMLTSTTTTPLYGKLSDLYGRRGTLFFVAIALFLAGLADVRRGPIHGAAHRFPGAARPRRGRTARAGAGGDRRRGLATTKAEVPRAIPEPSGSPVSRALF